MIKLKLRRTGRLASPSANSADKLRGGRANDFISQLAEGTGVEPVSPEGHWFSRPTHYRPAHPP